MWVGTGNAASFDSRVTNSILETKRFLLVWQNMAILPPDCRDALQLLICLAGTFERGFKMLCVRRNCSDDDVDIRGPERLFPILRTAFAVVTEYVRPRGHSLLKFQWKALKRCAWYAQRFEALKAEGSTHPGVTGRACWVGCRSDDAA